MNEKIKYHKAWDQHKAINHETSDFTVPKLDGFEEMLFAFITFLMF